MIHRRDILMAGACLVAAAGAYQLKPRDRMTLLTGSKIADVIPTAFGAWASQGDDALVRPETSGKLAELLYSELVSRIYSNEETGSLVMVLVAYGDTQSDLLQLHRPESCYPAVGFQLKMSQAAPVPLGPNGAIPGRRVIAERSGRRESIVYWTRLGEFLPDSASAQREARFLTAVKGYIPDGALFRFSTLRTEGDVFADLDQFISGLVRAVAPAARKALIGSELAAKI